MNTVELREKRANLIAQGWTDSGVSFYLRKPGTTVAAAAPAPTASATATTATASPTATASQSSGSNSVASTGDTFGLAAGWSSGGGRCGGAAV